MSMVIIANFSFVYLYLKKYLNNKDTDIFKPTLLATAGIYIILFQRFGFGIDSLFLISITSILILITITDLMEMLIPDILILMMIILSMIFLFINYILNGIKPDMVFHLSGLLVGGLIFLIIILISKGGMGLGDVTLISAIGFIIGPQYILLNILLSFFTGALISVFLLLTKIKSKEDPIPFGPFIILAFYITKLYGDKLIIWYLNLL